MLKKIQYFNTYIYISFYNIKNYYLIYYFYVFLGQVINMVIFFLFMRPIINDIYHRERGRFCCALILLFFPFN